MNKRRIVIILLVVIIVGLAIFWFGGSTEEVTEPTIQEVKAEAVATAVVSELQTQEKTLTTYGQVVSVSRVEVIPEISGIVRAVRGRLGQTVRPGETVVELENQSQAQQLASARATLESAQAAYQQTIDEADQNEVAGVESALAGAQASLDSAVQNTISSLDGLYTSLETTIKRSFDGTFFSNTHTQYPDFKVDIYNEAEELELAEVRRVVEDSFAVERSYDDVNQALRIFEIQVGKSIDLIAAVRQTIADQRAGGDISQQTIEGWRETLSDTQSVLDSLLSQSTSLASNLEQGKKAVSSAQANLDDVLAGANQEEIAIARSAVDQARSAVDQAQTALEKTRIKAPVLGTISSLDVRIGQLVGPAQAIFTIANESALRIDSKVSPDMASLLEVGDGVVINDLDTGTIATIAPSVDEATGQVDFEVLLSGSDTTLISGTGVTLEIGLDQDVDSLSVPISAVFVRGNKPQVYVVEDERAVVRSIVTDNLFGETVVVTEGLELSDRIVLNAREVKDGDVISSQ